MVYRSVYLALFMAILIPTVGRCEEDQLQVFLNQENARLREIKMLDLDVTKANLQLKQKEIESKIAQLTPAKESGEEFLKPSETKEKGSAFRLKGILTVSGERVAMIQINEQVLNLKKGDVFNSDYKIFRIDIRDVVITDLKGNQTTISLT